MNHRAGWRNGMVALVTLLTGIASSAFAQVVERQVVMRESEQRLKALLEGSGGELRVSQVFFRDPLNLPDGRVDWAIRDGVGELKPGRQSVAVAVTVDGRPATVIQVAATLKQLAGYPVLRRAVKRGEVVSEADLRWEEKELDREIPGLVRDAGQVAGQAAAREIKPNRPLQEEWFGSPVAVKRGERLRVVMERGPLTIETVGVARSAGRVGETISLENPDSHRRFEARILEPGRAKALSW